jgi:hypothetical protein
MNAMIENPNIAKPILYYIFNVYGTGEFSYIHLTSSCGFTDKEYNIALKIYKEHEEVLKKEKAEEQQRRIIQETEEEEALLNRWVQNGPDTFEDLSDSHIISPEVRINLNNLSQKLSSNPTYKPLSDFSPTKISFDILPEKTITNLIVVGTLRPSFDLCDVIVIEPAKYKFEHLDKIMPVSCQYSMQVTEDADLLGYIECKIKYNNKTGLWDIEILDNEKDPESYQWIYNNTEFSEDINSTAKDAIAAAIVQAINAKEVLKSKLSKGKHKLYMSVYNHYIQSESTKAYLQPFVDSIFVDKK